MIRSLGHGVLVSLFCLKQKVVRAVPLLCVVEKLIEAFDPIVGEDVLAIHVDKAEDLAKPQAIGDQTCNEMTKASPRQQMTPIP